MDDLDLLIDSALGEPDASESEPDDTTTPDTEEATTEAAVEDVVDSSDEDPSGDEEAEEDDAEPGEPDGTLAPAQATPPAPVTPDDPDAWRRKALFQEEILTKLATAQKRKQEQEANQAAEDARNAQIEALKQRWAEMDPEDAANERANFVAREAETTILSLNQRLQQIENEKLAAQEARDEAEAKAIAIPMIMQKFGLKDDDREILEELTTPQAMEKFAAKQQARRQTQTAKAREAKAEKAKANPALKVTSPGTTAPKSKPDYQDVDELLNAMFPG